MLLSLHHFSLELEVINKRALIVNFSITYITIYYNEMLAVRRMLYRQSVISYYVFGTSLAVHIFLCSFLIFDDAHARSHTSIQFHINIFLLIIKYGNAKARNFFFIQQHSFKLRLITCKRTLAKLQGKKTKTIMAVGLD